MQGVRQHRPEPHRVPVLRDLQWPSGSGYRSRLSRPHFPSTFPKPPPGYSARRFFRAGGKSERHFLRASFPPVETSSAPSALAATFPDVDFPPADAILIPGERAAKSPNERRDQGPLPLVVKQTKHPMSPSPFRSRNRFHYALFALAVVAAGLFWRSGIIPLPGCLSNNGGDALWALMVFLGFGFLLPRAPTARVALLSLAFAWGIEFLQLYQAPWINSIRGTIPGKLVLGNTFHWSDLLAYAAGIVMGALWEWRRRGGNPIP